MAKTKSNLFIGITINKSQEQTSKYVGIYLQKECFSHGQLYDYIGLLRIENSENKVIVKHPPEINQKMLLKIIRGRNSGHC